MLKSNIALAFFASCTALLVGCVAQDEAAIEEEVAEATEQPIVNGQPANAYTEAALINASGYICSGAIIAPRVALTAGHCVTANNYTVVAPYASKQAKGSKKWTTYVSTGSYVNPNTLDVAVIILDTPIQLSWYPPLSSAPVPMGTKVVNVGRIKNGQASYSGLFYGKDVTLESASGFPYAWGSDEVIQSGDSGGPVYMGSGSNRKIVAVNSGAGGGTQILARVDLAYAKIQELIAQNGGSGSGSSGSGSSGSSGSSGGASSGGSSSGATTACTSNESEPNDDSTAANALTTKSCGALSAGDVDWFEWTIGASGIAYDVKLATTGDADILMWKNTGRGWSRMTNTSSTQFAATSSGAGTYVVAVRSQSSSAQSYTLSLKK